MELKTIDDNTSVLKVVSVVLLTWLFAALFIFCWYWAINKVQASDTITPILEQQVITQDYYQVATTKLTSNITGDAIVSMGSFIVPVKFTFDTSIEHDESVIEINNLEIGVITDITGKHKYNDFTINLDHQGINAALVSYIKKHNLTEGI
ncbi:hypothetical protein F900_01026 [Acinetobacter modestus]|uniref:Uncharacterized protein n=1 Tax=Acinetobacter modestus TaxID=1776740 RepID=N9NKS5_9GAMM|nr:hypothetical protein [Acinetobacter modestus]ENX02580.1 hypothetical protein F900_01026 [Acinetobacter modestus]